MLFGESTTDAPTRKKNIFGYQCSSRHIPGMVCPDCGYMVANQNLISGSFYIEFGTVEYTDGSGSYFNPHKVPILYDQNNIEFVPFNDEMQCRYCQTTVIERDKFHPNNCHECGAPLWR